LKGKAVQAGFTRRLLGLSIFVTGVVGAVTHAATPSATSPGVVPASLQSPVLVDRWGVEHVWSSDLSTFPDGARAFAVIFLDVNCPIVTRLSPELNNLDEQYRRQGVQFLGIYSNEGLTRMEMASHKQKLDLTFPVFLDVDGRLARLLTARVTPEVFLLDAELRTKYRGMINDAGWKKVPGAKPNNYLADAIDALLAGRKPPAETRAQGCELQLAPLVRKPPAKLLSYHADVAPIIHKRCVSCHFQGGIGPFELDDFEAVRAEIGTIRREVDYQRMPPWHADVERGLPIANVQALTDVERRTVLDWIAQGYARRDAGETDWLVEGTPPAVPLELPHIPAPGEFTIGGGKPDFVARMPKPFVVPASTLVPYQYFWIPNESTEDRYIQEIEALPGNHRVVHHMQVFLVDRKLRPADTSGAITGALMMIKLNGYGGSSTWRIGSYTPGDQYAARKFESDEGVHFPAGYDLVFEIHYTPIDENAVDQSSVGIVWRKTPDKPKKLFYDQLFLRPRNVRIEPHEPHVKTELFPYFKQNVVLLDVRPHMHLRGGDARLSAVFPDGREQVLVVVPAFDFNWQRRYLFQEPLRLPAGSTLRMIGHWDNTRLNPNNPDPGTVVLFGEASFDEMSNIGVTFRVDDEAEATAARKVTSPVPR
jgi:hypothetical protein